MNDPIVGEAFNRLTLNIVDDSIRMNRQQLRTLHEMTQVILRELDHIHKDFGSSLDTSLLATIQIERVLHCIAFDANTETEAAYAEAEALYNAR